MKFEEAEEAVIQRIPANDLSNLIKYNPQISIKPCMYERLHNILFVCTISTEVYSELATITEDNYFFLDYLNEANLTSTV